MISYVFPSGRELKEGTLVKHFKGSIYTFMGISEHTETGDKLVVYLALDTLKLWVRPVKMFDSLVDIAKYPDSSQKYRFEVLT